MIKTFLFVLSISCIHGYTANPLEKMYNIQYNIFFKALADIESGGNDRAIGSKGEVSAFQILPSIWRTYADCPCSPYHVQRRDKSIRVARKLNSYNLCVYNKDTGNLPQAYDMYVMWNYGVTKYRKLKYIRSSLPKKVRERAERFVNTLQIYEQKHQ